jgi:hypothetical protein
MNLGSRVPFCLALLLAIGVGGAQCAAADSQESIPGVAAETAIDLGGQWRFKVVSQVEESLFDPATDDRAWAATTAPGRWADQGIQPEDLTVVVYRRTVAVPAAWQGKAIGISAWFSPGSSMVFVNGEQVDPQGPAAAPFADVSGLLHYGKENLIAVSCTGDGIREMAESGPPLLGPLGSRTRTKVVRQDVVISTPTRPMKGNLFFPDGASRLPVVVFAATGHADYPLKDDWQVLNEDMARQGFVSLAVAFNQFTAAEFAAVRDYLKGLEMADPSRIALVGAMRATRFAVQSAIADDAVRALVLVSSAKVAEISQLGSRPVLLVCSEAETFAPTVSIAKKMADQLTGPSRVITLPGKASGVNILDADWNQFRQELLGWLKKFLSS